MDTKACQMHWLTRLPPGARPYRYQCVRCGKKLKIASGLVVAQQVDLMMSLSGKSHSTHKEVPMFRVRVLFEEVQGDEVTVHMYSPLCLLEDAKRAQAIYHQIITGSDQIEKVEPASGG